MNENEKNNQDEAVTPNAAEADATPLDVSVECPLESLLALTPCPYEEYGREMAVYYKFHGIINGKPQTLVHDVYGTSVKDFFAFNDHKQGDYLLSVEEWRNGEAIRWHDANVKKLSDYLPQIEKVEVDENEGTVVGISPSGEPIKIVPMEWSLEDILELEPGTDDGPESYKFYGVFNGETKILIHDQIGVNIKSFFSAMPIKKGDYVLKVDDWCNWDGKMLGIHWHSASVKKLSAWLGELANKD